MVAIYYVFSRCKKKKTWESVFPQYKLYDNGNSPGPPNLKCFYWARIHLQTCTYSRSHTNEYYEYHFSKYHNQWDYLINNKKDFIDLCMRQRACWTYPPQVFTSVHLFNKIVRSGFTINSPLFQNNWVKIRHREK